MSIDPDVPNNNLAFIPPKVDLETNDILKQLNKTSRVLGELKGYANLLPNKQIILSSIVLDEAKDSSEIENIITTHDDLYKANIFEDNFVTPSTKEVMNYKKALYTGLDLIREKRVINSNIIKEIQSIIVENNQGFRKSKVTIANAKTKKTVYTPPDDINSIILLLKDLEEFINSYNDIDPLIKMVIIHAQFESIHPFYDGNGRTGRIINVLYLVLEDLLHEPFLYLSKYIIHNKNEYYLSLRKVNYENNWHDLILYMLKAVEITSQMTLKLSKDIVKLHSETKQKMKALLGNSYKSELVDILFCNHYTRISKIEEELKLSRNTVSTILNKLEPDILRSFKIGRDKIFINYKLINLIEIYQKKDYK